jgi:hypothetical protein
MISACVSFGRSVSRQTVASNFRAEGSLVIRHLNRFYMNNRNTVGEALFVRDPGIYPAPKDDDPVPGSLLLADASGNWTGLP